MKMHNANNNKHNPENAIANCLHIDIKRDNFRNNYQDCKNRNLVV